MRTLVETEIFEIDECGKALQAWIIQVGSGETVPERGFYLDKINHWQFIPYFRYPTTSTGRCFRLILDIEISWTHQAQASKGDL